MKVNLKIFLQLLLILILKLNTVHADTLGCDFISQQNFKSILESQGFKVAKIFQTNVLTYQYGNTKNFELMAAYQLENPQGVVKFVTCKGLYDSPYRSGEYVSDGSNYGGYVKVEPFMNPFYEVSFKGLKKTGDYKDYETLPSIKPFNGPLTRYDVKFNFQGEVSQIFLGKSRDTNRELWSKSSRILEPDCIKQNLPFRKSFLSNQATAKTQEASYKDAVDGLSRMFSEKKDACLSSMGIFNTCKKSRYRESTSEKYDVNCEFNDIENNSMYQGTLTSFSYRTPGEVTTEIKTFELLCDNNYPWKLIKENRCKIDEVLNSDSPNSEIKVIDIRDSAHKEDILIPNEIVIPPGGVKFKLINYSSFYIQFSGSTSPTDGSLQPLLNSKPDSILLKAMPGNELRLIPYPNKIHYIRFTN